MPNLVDEATSSLWLRASFDTTSQANNTIMSPSAILEDAPVASDCSIAQSNPLATQKYLQSQYTSGHPSLAYVDEEAENPPKFSDPYEERAYLKHRLAIAFRVFAQFGLAEGVAGHITLRDPVDPNSFWVNPFGTHFSLIRDEDLIRVDHDGKVVEGGKNKRLNYGEYPAMCASWKERY